MKMMPVNKDELRGIKTPAAYQVYFALLVGYFSVPAFGQGGKFVDFLASFKDKTLEERREILKLAANITPIADDDYLKILSFAKDQNGVPIGRENIRNMTAQEILAAVVEVALAFSETELSF